VTGPTAAATRHGKWVRVAGVALAVGFAVAAFAFWQAYGHSRRQLSESRCAGHETFVRSDWMDTTKAFGRLAVRGCMVDDLLDKHELNGLTRAEVVALIGEPPATEYFKDFDLVYWLGPERGLIGIDSEWLVIRLDSRQRVSEARLVTD
jgi:hypothetical protein